MSLRSTRRWRAGAVTESPQPCHGRAWSGALAALGLLPPAVGKGECDRERDDSESDGDDAAEVFRIRVRLFHAIGTDPTDADLDW